MTSKKICLHLIPNAHLDPVWLWDLREGLAEGIATCQTVVDLMSEFPQLTFIRGESLIYETLERYAPELFGRIQDLAAEGRWDVVGGTYVQADNNLASEITLLKQFAVGRHYFDSRFGQSPTAAWSADSFGHPAGYPSILVRSGMDSFAFTRPQAEILPLESPAFWWEAPDGLRVLAYRPEIGWYGTARHEMVPRLDGLAAWAETKKLRNVAAFMGLGDHGGGPTRRQIREALAWADRHPEFEVVFSGLHRFFAELRAEAAELPTYRGELGFCLRGCYASAAHVKAAFRRAEDAVRSAEEISEYAHRLVGHRLAPLEEPWRAVLLNSFHDILPGSSIERALTEQIEEINGASAEARQTAFDATLSLAAHIDTLVPHAPEDEPDPTPFLIVNTGSEPFDGFIELEANLDYRPIEKYQGRCGEVRLEVRGPHGEILPSQNIDCEHRFDPRSAFRGRVVSRVQVPGLGWMVASLGVAPDSPSKAASDPPILIRADKGDEHVNLVWPDGNSLSLDVLTVEDPYGSWGSMAEAPEALSLHDVRHNWTLTDSHELEFGPLRWTRWLRLTGGPSRLDLLVRQFQGEAHVLVEGRLLFADEAARVQIGFPVGDWARFDSPGAPVTRTAGGEVPGGRWVQGANGSGFASDWLSAFDHRGQVLWATIARSAPYACDDLAPAPASDPIPRTDLGEHCFRIILTPFGQSIEQLANRLCRPPVIQRVAATAGSLARSGVNHA